MSKSLYYHSLADAKQFGEIDLWRESRKENIRCAKAIDEAIRNGFDGMHLDGECVKPILEEFGFQRVKWVLSNTLHELAHDGRFLQSNRKWLSDTYVPKDGGNYEFTAKSHPAVLDGFIGMVKKQWDSIGLFTREHCISEKDGEIDYTGKVVVFSADCMKDDHLHPEEQLFLAEGGFGCHPNSRGTKVFGQFLCDGERCHLTRNEIAGVLKDEFLPDWARDKLDELLTQSHDEGEVIT